MKLSRLVFLVMFFLGLALMSSYLVTLNFYEQQVLPELLFWAGAFLFSSSLILFWNYFKEQKYLLILIVVAAFFIYGSNFLRFNYYGTDIVGEYNVASITQQLGQWPQNLVTPQPFGSFFSCLSVTVLPTIVSDLTGLPMMLIFKILIPLTATLVIVGVFSACSPAF